MWEDVSMDGEVNKSDDHEMEWIYGEQVIHESTPSVLWHMIPLGNVHGIFLGTSDLWGCGCEFHHGRVGFAGAFTKEALQRCDAGNLEEPGCYR